MSQSRSFILALALIVLQEKDLMLNILEGSSVIDVPVRVPSTTFQRVAAFLHKIKPKNQTFKANLLLQISVNRCSSTWCSGRLVS